jgi:hypothetical protein
VAAALDVPQLLPGKDAIPWASAAVAAPAIQLVRQTKVKAL